MQVNKLFLVYYTNNISLMQKIHMKNLQNKAQKEEEQR